MPLPSTVIAIGGAGAPVLYCYSSGEGEGSLLPFFIILSNSYMRYSFYPLVGPYPFSWW